jgi:hypothetical protein
MQENKDIEKFKNDDAYYSDNTYLSNSMLKLLRESPTKFHLMREGKWSYPTASYFDIGTALHALFLEGKQVAMSFSGRRGTNEYKALVNDNPGMLIMPDNDYKLVMGMYDKLNKLDEVKDLMGITFEAEVPMTGSVITDLGNEIPIKGKADALVFDGVETYLVDLKTSAKPLEEWKRSAPWMLYNQQAYMYKTLFGVDSFYFLVVEKTFPYEVGIYRASDDFLSKGEWEFNKSINLYEKTFLNGIFNPYSARIGEL